MLSLIHLHAASQKVMALGRSIGVSPTKVRKGIVEGPEIITLGKPYHHVAKC